MRRFNVMLNGSRLMMFPFYVCILICVALLMVKFAMQLYVLCRDIIDIHYLDLITGVLTLVDFVLVAQMLILVAICGYVQFIKTPEQRAALGRGQQHHAVRVGDLAVQRLHDRHRVLEEKTVFFQRALQLRDGQAGVVGAVIGRYAKRFGAQVRLVDERSGIHVRRCRLRHVGLLDQRAVHVVS